MGRKLCLKRKTRPEAVDYDVVPFAYEYQGIAFTERRRTFSTLATQPSGSQYSCFFSISSSVRLSRLPIDRDCSITPFSAKHNTPLFANLFG